MSLRRSVFCKCYILNLICNKSIDCRYKMRLGFFSTVRLPNENPADVNEIKDDVIDKIIYNEIFFKEKQRRRKNLLTENKAFMKECQQTSVVRQNRPLILNYYPSTDECSDDANVEGDINDDTSVVNFPYRTTKKIVVDDVNDNESPESELDNASGYSSRTYKKFKSMNTKIEYEDPGKYLGNDEPIADIEPIIETDNYGTCDPNIPCSNVPCSGCGALLHCMSMSIPGFMPKEIFTKVNKQELKALRCQRCLFLEEYNVALGINVNPDDYLKIISQISHNDVNIVLMIDLTDFPCSISKDILKFIENKRRIFIVGNKVDLLMEDGDDSLKHKKLCLTKMVNEMDIKKNIKYIGLISAKTGYGVERLISELHLHRVDQGHFYILGCTNSGKSTLFNRLIQSDMCKVKADLIQRATISQWPGTTLNLLKFPVSRRQDWHTFLRMQRLRVAKKQEAAVREIRKELMKDGQNCQVNLMGYIGKTKSALETNHIDETDDDGSKQSKSTKWFYDTPGVVHEAQILNLLTTYELTKILPSKIIVPRTFKLDTGHTLFIGGLARIDFLSGSNTAWFSVFASDHVPVTITGTDDADLIYKELLGTKWFVVPRGNKDRLEKWPPLKSKDLDVYGKTLDGRGGDVVLSSAGWVTVTPNIISICRIRAWTPDGRGIYLRQPTLIRNSFNYKGKKIANTPAYKTVMKVYDNIRVIDEKQNSRTIT